MLETAAAPTRANKAFWTALSSALISANLWDIALLVAGLCVLACWTSRVAFSAIRADLVSVSCLTPIELMLFSIWAIFRADIFTSLSLAFTNWVNEAKDVRIATDKNLLNLIFITGLSSHSYNNSHNGRLL